MDTIRLELGYGLLALAGGDAPRLTEQIKGLRRAIAAEMGFVLPPVRIQDNVQLRRGQLLHPHQGDRGRPRRAAADPAAGDGPAGRRARLPGERTTEPTFGLPALWIEPARRDEALARGCTVVDPPAVLTTHITELVRDSMAELLSYAETQKLLDELPREQQKLVADLVPSQISVGGVQRVLQALLAERVSIRDLPTVLEGIAEACGGSRAPSGRSWRMSAPAWPGRSATATPARAATSRWSRCRRTGSGLRREPGRPAGGPAAGHGAVQAGRVHEPAAQRLRRGAGDGEAPVLLSSGGIRAHLRAVVERIRPSHAGAGAGGDLPARPHPHGRHDLARVRSG